MFNSERQPKNYIFHFRYPLINEHTDSEVPLPSVSSSKSGVSAKAQENKTNQPQLSMIWVEESNGSEKRLVAKWVMED